MSARGEWNVGQLVREWHEDAAALIGFSTFQGTVTAASDWDGPAERKRVRPALPGSFDLLRQLLCSGPLQADRDQIGNALDNGVRHPGALKCDACDRL